MTWFQDKAYYLMGVINVTPDSFSDGGKFFDKDRAIMQGLRMMTEGADILDIGGESTRPGSAPVPISEEQARIMPAIMALKTKGAFISVDTRNAATMQACINVGADMINDITALTYDPAALSVVASFNGPVCLMHMQGTPETMQQNPAYNDVVEDVFAYLQSRIAACVNAGIDKSRIVADPGFGFGKTFEHNMTLIDRFDRFNDLGVTLLAGVSRKSFIGKMYNNAPVDQRVEGSVKVAKQLYEKGARILRVHDVAETKQAL